MPSACRAYGPLKHSVISLCPAPNPKVACPLSWTWVPISSQIWIFQDGSVSFSEPIFHPAKPNSATLSYNLIPDCHSHADLLEELSNGILDAEQITSHRNLNFRALILCLYEWGCLFCRAWLPMTILSSRHANSMPSWFSFKHHLPLLSAWASDLTGW